jgi:hypothetical protein
MPSGTGMYEVSVDRTVSVKYKDTVYDCLCVLFVGDDGKRGL